MKNIETDLIIISGMSGSGKSTAIKALEDIGYFCVDNFPPELVKYLANYISENKMKYQKMAITVDTRSIHSIDDYLEVISELESIGIDFVSLFLDSDNETLLKRYKETRRLHPFMDDSDLDLEQSIEKEREFMDKIKQVSSAVIDTSVLGTAELKQRILNLYSTDSKGKLNVNIISFGFKYGILQDADLVFDVRCLKNPYYVKELRPKTGNDQDVRDYVMSTKEAQGLFDHIKGYLEYSIPLYNLEGKSQLIVGIACTGGKHRSVTFANLLAKELASDELNVTVEHRDIKKA